MSAIAPQPVLHMGSLHSVEVVLVVLLAVGPFLALAGVILVARRREAREDLLDPSGDTPRDVATDKEI